MTEQVIDFLEPVEVEEQDSKLLPRSERQFDLLIQPLIEAAAVRNSGQEIMIGKKADLLFRPLAHLKIAHRNGMMRFAGEIDRTQY